MSALPGGDRENESDQSADKRLLTCVCCKRSAAYYSAPNEGGRPRASPSTPPEPSWTSPPDCTQKWSALFAARRHIYQLFKRQSMSQTNIFPVQAGPSSAGTLIGSAAPVWTGSSGGSLGARRDRAWTQQGRSGRRFQGKEVGNVP